ncbi:hypothetical protein [Dethiobacter alkaliphilus]|uniref:hypothetical protein n=1 Tax=Dethiobacter alkaliphilus TaxID=427926 RepID=UPI002227A09D|nr:hypothetical protein [Dethiobacter alkaliphilus]MCW3491690.1 hypothetical protein [Dethiobacter alkaliphilus]
MKRINNIVLFMLLAAFIAGCQSTIAFVHEELNLNELEGNILEWAQSLDDVEGVHLARVSVSRKSEEYYIFINNPDIYAMEMGHAQDINSLAIETNPTGIYLPNDTKVSPFLNKVYRITTTNRRAEQVVLNGEVIQVSDIENIK